jgi:exodeoxyribonuclease VII small subunit
MKEPGFEEALQELEKIVEELESDDPALETALAKFEKGVALSRRCRKILDETEKRVSFLLENADGDPVETPFSDSERNEAS